jgi:hypothetical protein
MSFICFIISEDKLNFLKIFQRISFQILKYFKVLEKLRKSKDKRVARLCGDIVKGGKGNEKEKVMA